MDLKAFYIMTRIKNHRFYTINKTITKYLQYQLKMKILIKHQIDLLIGWLIPKILKSPIYMILIIFVMNQ